jgi:proteasome accessory factor A
MRAGEEMLKLLGKSFLKDAAWREDTTSELRIHRRVVDAHGNTKGCHDNFGYPKDLDADTDYDLNSFLISYLQSRSFISGAGYVQSRGFRFAQKIEHTTEIENYGYHGRMFRFDAPSESATTRIEIGCSDANVSDWSALMRVGGAALALAVYNSPVYDELEEYVGNYGLNGRGVLETATAMNRPNHSSNGYLQPSSAVTKAIDFQRRLTDAALNKLQLYADLPIEYYKIAEELYTFIDDFEAVMAGRRDLSLLADRADWAAKLLLIQKSIERDRGFGIKREVGDIQSQAQDLRYDLTQIITQPNGDTTVVEGAGIKMRRRGLFKVTVDEKHVADAMVRPPQTTRAKNRGQLIKDYAVHSVDWDQVTIRTDFDSDHTIVLEHVDGTDISNDNRQYEPFFKKRK